MWPDERARSLFGIDVPVLQAPMAGSGRAALATAVANAGGLGALPCALLSLEEVRAEVEAFRQAAPHPLNLNFFCHRPPAPDAERDARWRARLAAYYAELGVDPDAKMAGPSRTPFDDAACDLVAELRPEVVSFHFGLPREELVARVKAAGAKVLSSATTVAEARWLEDHGCDAIIAQGAEAGGHRGMFLSDDAGGQVGTIALVPQIVDAVKVPVIAAGGIADGRGIAAAFMLGASAVQIGTAYLLSPEATVSPLHRAAVRGAAADDTVITNVLTGRPARGVRNRLMRELGALVAEAPAFPGAAGSIAPLRAKAEAAGSDAFSSLWSGQGAPLARAEPAGDVTRRLAADARERLRRQ